MASDFHLPAPIKGNEECPECGARLQDNARFWMGIAKAGVVGVAGLATTINISDIIHFHLWAVTHGQIGLGINASWLLGVLIPLMAGVLYWAFPKKPKGGDNGQ